MATAQQIKALITSFADGDEGRFRSVVLQIAAHAANQGKTKLADDLKALVDKAESKRTQYVGPTRAVPIARPTRELAGVVAASYPETRLTDMVLEDGLRRELGRVVTEYHHRADLRAHGLVPRSKILLVGPPGCGKTMSASALAGECRLPLMQVQLHGLITKFMGETAAKLHLVFDAMEKQPGVYLFDEFDAIGSVRESGQDVGEIRRVLNSFFQFLEQHASDSIIVAATNLRSLLDDALFRRFDSLLEYELPERKMVRPLIENRLASFTLKRLPWKKIADASVGLSHAEIIRAAEDAAKEAVLYHRAGIAAQDLIMALEQRSASRSTRASS